MTNAERALTGRYSRNGILTEGQQTSLAEACVAIVGAGGLGGYVAEQLARFGVGNLIIIDSDRFEETNLNRQLFSNESNLGEPKAEEACKRIAAVNSGVRCVAHVTRLTAENAEGLLGEADIVVDALDNPGTRFLLQDACAALGLPLVHGAISAWTGRVSFIRPGDDVLSVLYPGGPEACIGPAGSPIPAPPFSPGAVASLEVAETIKYLIGADGLLERKVLYIDLQTHEYDVLELEL